MFEEGDVLQLALIKCGKRGWKVVSANGEIRFFTSALAAIEAHAQDAELAEAEACGLFGAIEGEVACA